VTMHVSTNLKAPNPPLAGGCTPDPLRCHPAEDYVLRPVQLCHMPNSNTWRFTALSSPLAVTMASVVVTLPRSGSGPPRGDDENRRPVVPILARRMQLVIVGSFPRRGRSSSAAIGPYTTARSTQRCTADDAIPRLGRRQRTMDHPGRPEASVPARPGSPVPFATGYFSQSRQILASNAQFQCSPPCRHDLQPRLANHTTRLQRGTVGKNPIQTIRIMESFV
jgi:hypothetical protein